MSGFLAGIVSSFAHSPLLALAWRRREYLADATAVLLTRHPDTLAALFGTLVYLLVVVSMMLSMLFTMLPAGLLHALLRSVAQ